ncbi:MAG TPA: acetylxylan esterase [Microlunatus sp.]|nr:acetylxylan esterase [Microlunatus sp.]
MSDLNPHEAPSNAPEGAASWGFPATRRLRPPGHASPTALEEWRTTATRRLTDLLALPTDRTDGELIFTGKAIGDGEPQLITLATDDGDVPCWLLAPSTERRLDAAVVAVAGHGPRGIDALIDPRPDVDDFHGGLARKLAAAGFTVLCPEMISFGRRRTPMPDTVPATENTCQVDAMRGLHAGRPVLGRRVTDTLAAVRAVRSVGGVDPTKIAVVGGSGGGAVALFAGALDDQLPAAVVGTFFSSFAASVEAVPHCICNAVPNLATWFEMADIAAMIAPRRLIIEAGRHDPIFPVTATETAYGELVDVWHTVNAPSPDLVITDAGHQFLADDSIALLRQYFLSDR